MTQSATFTTSNPVRVNWITEELLRWVREVPLESDAITNIPVILIEYEKRMTFWHSLKLLLKKI